MGLFDYLKIECELPGLTAEQVKSSSWQTKDTPEQYMERYRLTADGKLMHQEVRYDTTPEDERPLCKDKPPKDRTDVDKFCGMLTSVVLGEKDQKWSGCLEFHGGPDGSFITFAAWFKGGVCVDIQRLYTLYDKEPLEIEALSK